MRIRQRVIVAASLTAGTVLAVLVGYGLYYRSDHYRHRVEAKLTRFLGLPVEIAAVRPRGLRCRELEGVQIWSPDHRVKIIQCPRVVWDKNGTATTPGPTVNIYDPALVLDAEPDANSTYASLWQKNLSHALRNVRLRRVLLHHGRIEWPGQKSQHMSADRIDGLIDFGEGGTASVQITVEAMNGEPVAPPMRITAQLAPTQESVSFHGSLRHLPVNALAAHFGVPPVGGDAELTLSRSEIADGRIRSLKMAGECTGGSLAALSQICLGRPGLHGELRVRLNGLIIENDQLKSSDIDVFANPPSAGVASIDRALLVDVLQRQGGVSIPQTFLPERIDFVNMGVKLLIDDRRIRVLSAQTPAGPALITARLLGQDVPLLGDLDQSFPIQPLLDSWQQHKSESPWPLSKAPAAGSAPAPG